MQKGQNSKNIFITEIVLSLKMCGASLFSYTKMRCSIVTTYDIILGAGKNYAGTKGRSIIVLLTSCLTG